MEKLKLEGSFQSPAIVLDSKIGVFDFRGICFLTNAYEFFMPVLDWLDQYEKNPNPSSKFTFDFTYINTASQKMLFELLKKLGKMVENGHSVTIEWFYEENDDDLKSLGDDLLCLVNVPYKIISKDADD